MTRCEVAPAASLVLHADDFGMNRAITDGILRGFREGLLTSTSLLANAPDAVRALSLWQKLETLRVARLLPSSANRRRLREPDAPFDLGIHLNLTQGRPLTGKRYPRELLRADGQFAGIGRLFRTFHRRRPSLEVAVRSELSAQIGWMRDRGHTPTHVNGHQYIEMFPGLREPIRELLTDWGIGCLRVARERGLFQTTLLRGEAANWLLAHVKRFYSGLLAQHARNWGIRSPEAYFGTSHAGRINLALVRTFLAAAGTEESIEIGLHPATATRAFARRGAGFAGPRDAWHDPLAKHRPHELVLLTSQPLFDLLRSQGMVLGRLGRSAAGADTPAA